MPAAPARIPSIHFAALKVLASPTINPDNLLPSLTMYGASLPPTKPPDATPPSPTRYDNSLPPAKPPPPELNHLHPTSWHLPISPTLVAVSSTVSLVILPTIFQPTA
jgi:hypothetical protein